MSDLNYYAVAPPPSVPHKTGLTVWGILMIILGSLFGLSGLVSLGTVVVLAVARGGGSAGAVGLMAVSVIMMAALSGTLLWVGIGCCRGRRWTRPVVLALSGVAAASGLLSIVPTTMLMTAMVRTPPAGGSPGVPAGLMVAITVVTMTFSALLLIGVPIALLAWFRRPSVGRTLDVLDPAPARWTDGLPVPVLAWAVACLWLGGGMAAGASAGVWFWFDRVVTGGPAVGGAVIGVAVAAAGYGCYRRSPLAWAASVGLFALLTASAATFAVAGDMGKYQQVMADRTQDMTSAFTPATTRPVHSTFVAGVNPQVAPALMYAAATAYGLWVRRRVVATAVDAAGPA